MSVDPKVRKAKAEHASQREVQGRSGSTLSVAGYMLARGSGLIPLGPVFGCDVRSLSVELPLPVYRQAPHVATPISDQQYQEDVVAVDELDREVTTSRHRALDQLREAATRMSADTVLDVRPVQGALTGVSLGLDPAQIAAAVRPGPHPYLTRTLSYQLVGTAARGAPGERDEPGLSNLSAGDFWRLQRGGWRPVDVVGGCAHRFGASLWGGSTRHEVQGSTAVWKTAREAAIAQLKREAQRIGADGVLGVTIAADHQIFGWTERAEFMGQTGKLRRSRLGREGILVSVSVLGTAVRRGPEAVPDGLPLLRTMDLS